MARYSITENLKISPAEAEYARKRREDRKPKWYHHLFLIIFALLIILAIYGVIKGFIDHSKASDRAEARFEKFFEGAHELNRLRGEDKLDGSITSTYFLFGASTTGNISEKLKVTFSWKAHSGEYIISTVDATKIRVRIDNSITKPYVSFHHAYVYQMDAGSDVQELLEHGIDYIVVHCKEDQYKPNVNLDNL